MPLDPGALCMQVQYILKIILIFLHLQKFEAIHNKDYSVVIIQGGDFIFAFFVVSIMPFSFISYCTFIAWPLLHAPYYAA